MINFIYLGKLRPFTILIPPLRERSSDIPLLAQHFLDWLNNRVKHIDEQTMKVLVSYPWLGNIRELKNIIERAAILADEDTITGDLLPRNF
jgi:DNA-binding NtrC family response regulator